MDASNLPRYWRKLKQMPSATDSSIHKSLRGGRLGSIHKQLNRARGLLSTPADPEIVGLWTFRAPYTLLEGFAGKIFILRPITVHLSPYTGCCWRGRAAS